jgi:hypothetical protein
MSAPAVSGALAKAVREFNEWRFYDCHETLEDVWLDAGGKAPEATATAGFCHGLIKLAAGFHHLLRGNHHGAVTLLRDGVRMLEPYGPSREGVDVARLVDGAQACLDRLDQLGPERVAAFDRRMIPGIEWTDSGEALT